MNTGSNRYLVLTRWLLPLVAVLFVALPSVSEAADVYLNGVKVTGLSNQSFADAKVRLDDKGNVHITVEGVTVQAQGDGASSGNTGQQKGALSKVYWLISEKSAVGMTQYDIDVHINGQFVTRVKSADSKQVVMNVTKFMTPGTNRIDFTAVKSLGAGRKSFSPDHYLKLLLGEGAKSGQSLMIERQIVTYTRTAAQVENNAKQETFTAQ